MKAQGRPRWLCIFQSTSSVKLRIVVFGQAGSHVEFLIEVERWQVCEPRRHAEQSVFLSAGQVSALRPRSVAHKTGSNCVPELFAGGVGLGFQKRAVCCPGLCRQRGVPKGRHGCLLLSRQRGDLG